jgi:hypothetical protein
MTVVKLMLVLSSMSVLGWGDVITTTYCEETYGNTTTTQTDPLSCSVAAGTTFVNNIASASISNTQTLPTAGSPALPVGSSFTLNVSTSGSDIAGGMATVYGLSTLQLTTTGPVRPGYLAFTEADGIAGIVATMDSSETVGGLSQSCTQDAVAPHPICTGNFSPVGNGSGMVAFTLGQGFVFTQVASASAAGGASIPHYGSGGEAFTFTLLESDGVTPVQLYAVPEPATYMLLLCGFLAISAPFHANKRIHSRN